MKRTSKALLAAFICSFALVLGGCGSTNGGGSSAANGTSTVSTAESHEEQPAASTTESTADEPTSSANSSPESAPNDELSPLWDNAQYKEDAEVGEGAHSVLVEVKIGSRSVTLTVKSDKDNLADMLAENGLVDGDTSEYGLYIKKVNGVTADYDVDNAYWGLCKDGEPTPVGASAITVTDGEHYELVYTKADAFDTAT